MARYQSRGARISRNRFGKPDPIKRNRVTDNMAEFVNEGKLTETEKRREGRRTSTGRRATPRDPWGKRIPITKSSGGTDSARRKRIETAQKYNKRMFGGANRKVTSSGDVGARAIKDRRAKFPGGGQRYKPITEADGPRGGTSKYQSRTNRIKRRYSAGTEGSRKMTASDDWYPAGEGSKKVTKGKGKKVAGYMTDTVRKKDPPKGKTRYRSGQGRTNTTGPNAQKTNQRTGSSPMREQGKPGSANDTGARRTGGGKTPTKGAGKSRTTGYAKKNVWSGETPEARKTRVTKLHNAMRQGKPWGKHMNPRAKQLIKMGASLAGGGKGRLVKALLRELGFASLERFKQIRDEGRNKTKKPVANLPADYKKTEKREFKKDKRRRRTKRLGKKM